ncbi:Von Willebrand factor type A-like domain containing protein [Bacteroides phage PhiCrAssBcn1]|nr:Von Willebrand factor type A-like domain containing protein [Bacteroides phage PhiCrAssBcn4]WCF57008.1 Von Willebrand factor type A-like domain containing protein [Bacteroides phage PhiCrAssBcn9]WCF57367.1 Von Willebrand factor type A-like domain containing protein [Bacteroides phage PhiCrAssBcn1]WCF57540.1 Von Willebrand factor type A-like domain containing protein [Bacteroides phage PhiCrAssBcn2]WCF57584.1 Von Willebrand factor type A-like domain containing protein [Bacteroides phage PhiCr
MRTNLIKTKELPKVVEPSTTDGMLDMVIAFDTTGSMSAYINAVKTHVKELVPKLFSSNPDLRIGIVAFGDYCDMKSKDNFGKAYQVLNLTNDENRIIKFINEAQDTHGGDGDEFYELVIKKITEETAWREGSTKAVLLIADAEPHKVGYSYKGIVSNAQIDWREEAKKASELGIKFDTMTINPIFVGWYKELSAMTNGVSVPFNNSSKTSQVVEAAALSRGGTRTKALYEATMDFFKGDAEMTAVYNAYSKEVTD